MRAKLPLVSVIIPAYNAEPFIRDTLDSVLSQTYQNIEVLVVDDGSRDNTTEIVENLAKNDLRIILLHQTNQGVAAARNLAIKNAKGEYIAPIDADDIWFPEKLERQMEVMLNSDSSVGLVYAWSVYIEEDSTLTKTCQTSYVEGDVYINLLYGNFLGNASSTLIRRSCFNRVGGYNRQMKEQDAQGCEDWELYLRISEYYKFRVVPEVLIGYRQVIGSMSFNDERMKRSCEFLLRYAHRKFPEIPTIIYKWSLSNFSWYLGLRSNQCGNHFKAILYLFDAAKLDFLPLLRPGFYRLLIKHILQMVAQPVTSLIWPNHNSWVNFQKKLRFFEQKVEIPTLNKRLIKNRNRFPWKQYRWFIESRCDRIEKECQFYTKLPQLTTVGK